MGTWWTEEYDTLSRVWGNSRTRKGHGVQGGFVSATIGGQKVILVSQPVYSGEAGKEAGRLHLWLTDLQRIYDFGPISAGNENVAASTLLYAADKTPSSKEPKDVKGKLYCSYEVAAEGGNYSVAFVNLTEKLEDVKKVLATWKEVDERASQLCSTLNAADGTSTTNDCSTGNITNGLVGFLSNTSTEDTWKDEYLGVNATVNKGTGGKVTRTEKGVTFQGAWAEWPVGKKGQNVPYYFANYKFTLMATVTIDEVPEAGSSPIPLIGVRMNDTDETVLVALSYTHDKKWNVTVNGKPQNISGDAEWLQGRTYQVALKRKFEKLSVHVDGLTIYDSREYREYYEQFYQGLEKLME
ncbi:trans-sialidase, putative, partial [Trypanosoma cruzi marinkellei]